MAPIRYSLHYEDYSEHLMSRFGKLLQMQSLVDMTLMCSSHTLRVHKAVLAASSAYFQELLQKQTGEPLIILKMRFSVLKSLVEFMYCGKTQCLEENLDELVSAAQFLKIKGLSKVTKEGLGITKHSELPIFTPPVVINRPPQSLIDLHSQDTVEPKPPPVPLGAQNSCQPVDGLNRTNKDMVVRIPFDIESGGTAAAGAEYADAPRAARPRRGRPSVRRSGWDGGSALGRATERALLRREQDSRKAIHQLKHLQTRHMQDYMDRVTLSQAVDSICDPESSTNNYLNMDNDLMYMDQAVSSNALDPTLPFSKESLMSETITSSFANASTTNSTNDTAGSGISTAMSQYVNALKNAGLPTDLPILFESGDGSYINVNEQVLLDMVQSSEIQYEVIEQPNIIEKVADPSEIKSIDDLSKSIERGEILMGSKSYGSSNYDKDSQFSRHEDAINSLSAILPDNLESFAEQQNYVVLGQDLQENPPNMDSVNSHDFSCIDSDMQFFTKSMSDDVKKFYEDQQLNDARVMEQLCPSTSLDTSFNMSLLDSKISNLNENMSQSYSNMNNEDLRRNDDCYDFSLQLPQGSDFKEDPLDCLISSSKQSDDERNDFNDRDELDKRAQERDDLIKDLMNIEEKIKLENSSSIIGEDKDSSVSNGDFNVEEVFQKETCELNKTDHNEASIENSEHNVPNELQWNDVALSENALEKCETGDMLNDSKSDLSHDKSKETNYSDPVIDLTEHIKLKTNQWDDLLNEDEVNKDNLESCSNHIADTLEGNIPFAVGLLPLKQIQTADDEVLLKRKKTIDSDTLDTVDAKCLKRKVKYKKM
ncbi:putative leucine-rich repeat-containing protein DDB_G0290503 [Battus philenor]|uniref:putative leucine-rich repeat-containing protein DDB_G0290503 n=1 Tax=Battus philenor TaxID=42288 RepID=UPI0035D0FDED